MKIIIIILMLSSEIINKSVNGDLSISITSILSHFNILHLIFPPLEPEVNMNAVQLIQHMGFTVEVHNVTTKDGYILGMQRIPNKSTNQNKNPVLVLHGLAASSSDWVINLRYQSLAYVLSDAGYDVWLGNFRGNEYSRCHVSLNPDKNEFWKFSWDEMAEYDLPAMIDYVLDVTGKSQIIFVGHSMGTTAGFAMLASKPEYNDKIQKMFAVGPLVFWNHLTDPFYVTAFKLWKFYKLLARIFQIDGVQLQRYHKFVVILYNSPLRRLFMKYYFYPAEEEWKYMNTTRLPVYFSKTPTDYSINTLDHYYQIWDKKQWQHYDWGSKKNLAKYGIKTPPQYDISNVKVPVALFRGTRDVLANAEDVHELGKCLKNLIDIYEIKGWSHFVYPYATTAGEVLHKKILELAEN